MDDFIIRSLLAGLGVAVVAGPLGCFMVWRRLAFFGDTLAHGALAGVVIGLVAGLNLTLTVTTLCIALALALHSLQGQSRFASDTLLGLLSHSVFAIGLIAIAVTAMPFDLEALLFGNILAVQVTDLVIIYVGGGGVLIVLWRIWSPLFALTVSQDLAEAEGIKSERLTLVYVILLATAVAVALKVLGVLLISAMLVIPAATARSLTRTPEAMAVGAAGTGCLAVVLGLAGSLQWDIPTGPSIVASASLLFVASLLWKNK